MKYFIIVLTVFISYTGFAQTWQILRSDDYLTGTPSGFGTFLYGPADHKSRFRINPYDSSIWMARNNYVMQFDNNGVFHWYGSNDHPTFDNFADFRNVAFTTDKVYTCNEYYGLFEFDGVNWVQLSSLSDGVYLASDVDTIWMGRQSGNDLIIMDGVMSFGIVGNRKLSSKFGEFWGSSGGYLRRFSNSLSYEVISADTIGYLLGNDNYYFTFSPNDNRFYTCGDKGISIALDQVFIDTITPNNTTGMPQLPVMEIAFDSQDNIWATFGDPANPNINPLISFGYLDRSTGNWTIYDSSNSPVANFKGIEVDPCDNLWVSEVDRLLIYKVGSCQANWLSLHEETTSELKIYPNPSKGNISITTDLVPTSIRITNLSGQVLKEMSFSNSIQLDLSAGVYFLELMENSKSLGVERIIVE